MSGYVLLLRNLQQSTPLSVGASTYWLWVMAVVVLEIHLPHRELREHALCMSNMLFVRVVEVLGFVF